jgi:hypothetical protein
MTYGETAFNRVETGKMWLSGGFFERTGIRAAVSGGCHTRERNSTRLHFQRPATEAIIRVAQSRPARQPAEIASPRSAPARGT